MFIILGMKLCIIGPGEKKQTETDLRLLETAKKNFQSVLYVPYSNISLNIDRETRIRYKNIDLSKFDAILPRIPRGKNLFAYMLLNVLNKYSPVSAHAFLATHDRFLMFQRLKMQDIPVPKAYFTNSIVSAKNFLSEMNFPISLRMPGTEKGVMFASSIKEANTMLDTLGAFKSSVYMEEFTEDNYIQVYVLAGRAIAMLKRLPKEPHEILHGKGVGKRIGLSKEMRNLAISAANSVKADFAMVEMSRKQCVFNINICPPLIDAMNVTGVKIDQELMGTIKTFGQLAEKPELSWIARTLRGATTIVKDLFER